MEFENLEHSTEKHAMARHEQWHLTVLTNRQGDPAPLNQVFNQSKIVRIPLTDVSLLLNGSS
jgi:hypothetical protein